MTPLVDQFPKTKLTPQAESLLAVRAKQGDEDAANELVMATMREALLYTQRTCRDSMSEDERTSLCYRKLMMCVKRFDPSRRIRFFAFCKPALRGQMKSFWEGQNVVRNASSVVSADVLGGWFHHGRIRPSAEWVQTKGNLVKPTSSEDDLGESFREDITGETEPPALDAICHRDRWSQVEKLIQGKLNSRQRMIITLVYKSGLNFPEIAKLLGVTRSLIHAVHRKAISKIRDEIAKDGRLLNE